MARFGRKLQNIRWGESRGEEYPWQERDDQYNFSWLKKSIVAIIIFVIVYGFHISDTTVGQMVDEGIQYTVSTQTDFAYVIEQVVSRAPSTIDLSVLKKVQMAVSKPADPLLYMSKPVSGKIVSPFGWRVHPVSKQEMMHEGIDIESPLGSNIKAAAAGIVKAITDNAQYGKTLIVEHSQDVDTLYGHLGEILVKQGDVISQGQVIGKVGKTGMVNGPLLYFEVRERGKAIDPETRLKGDFPTTEGK
ncbi:MAG: M23 family metallopeptidase [Sporomusaceae bacterium]|nr:M23 family metallopeptidase [Sporomusaceae bacterium]